MTRNQNLTKKFLFQNIEKFEQKFEQKNFPTKKSFLDKNIFFSGPKSFLGPKVYVLLIILRKVKDWKETNKTLNILVTKYLKTFLRFSIVSLQHMWKKARFLSPETESMSCFASYQTTSDVES